MEFSCPQTTRAKNAGGVSEFLADGITAVFGLENDFDTFAKNQDNPKWVADRVKNNNAKKDDFWRQIHGAATDNPILKACEVFIGKLGSSAPPFLHKVGNAWKIKSANGMESTLGQAVFTFKVNGDLLLANDDIRRWWREQHAAEIALTKGKSEKGLCIVTGRPDQPIAVTHGVKIKSVPGGQPTGALLVSFDKSAFASYGFEQSMNCPVSEDAATAYCTALNHIIQSRNSSLRLGNTLFCFWVEKSQKPQDFLMDLLNSADPLAIEEFMKSPWAGVERDVAEKDTFVSVTLVGNAGRVVVKHWMQQTLLQAVENFRKWFEDLSVCHIAVKSNPGKTSATGEKTTKSHPLSAYRLAATMAPPKKKNGMMTSDMDKLQADVLSQLYRAALENAAPSLSLVKPVLGQLHSRLVGDDNYEPVFDQSRFALLKLILNRNRKGTDMEIQTTLTADTDDSAYNSGRLLAVLAETQKKAHEYQLKGAGVVERYFGMASVSPASVFPLLLRLNRHHLDKIRKSDEYGGDERFLEEQIREILTKFKSGGGSSAPDFKRTLGLHEQGRFALGFYQQQADDAMRRSEAKEAREAKESAKQQA